MSQPPLKRLVFAGEAIIDVLMWVPALPERGGDMLAESAAVQDTRRALRQMRSQSMTRPRFRLRP